MVLGYGIAAMCMFSLLSHMTNESYLERDSKGISAPAKKALHAHPKYVITREWGQADSRLHKLGTHKLGTG